MRECVHNALEQPCYLRGVANNQTIGPMDNPFAELLDLAMKERNALGQLHIIH